MKHRTLATVTDIALALFAIAAWLTVATAGFNTMP